MKTAKDYLKIKGLKNPPIDSGIGGCVDRQRARVSDVMAEYAQQEAIEFYKWVDQNFISVTFDEDEGENLYEAYLPKDYPAKNTYYILELYKIWKDEKH